ncbi:uncharacterized protein BCR38DRAFT_45653 [Pseudomassariella vexata]|uniref:Uncharacterized protein n=1 Tax=Pseudomassariella vexata TaxID=1141098 RepID=A0A1Y2DPZ3_9PEZI|nr:uncharacterized protein BCR38DRAFT_45653 [Pseudomassariella vexata]ORY60725.1 hypothetical protein BCR38DRAFT_45653 [Pseudomassariella vexata]
MEMRTGSLTYYTPSAFPTSPAPRPLPRLHFPNLYPAKYLKYLPFPPKMHPQLSISFRSGKVRSIGAKRPEISSLGIRFDKI